MNLRGKLVNARALLSAWYGIGLACTGFLARAAGFEVGVVGEEAFSAPVASVPYPNGFGASAHLGVHGPLGVLAEFTATKIADLSDATNPRIFSGPALPQNARSVSIYGNYAYVGSGAGTVYIVDCADRQDARVVGTFGTPVNDFVIVNGHAIGGGLQVWSLANPVAPQPAGSLPEEANWFTCAFAVSDNIGARAEVQYMLQGKLTFVGPTKLRVYDLSAPAAARDLGSAVFNVYGAPQLTMEGDYVYLAYDHSLRVVSVANRAQPQARGTKTWSELGTRGMVSLQLAREGFLYLADADSRVTIIDVRNPDNPRKAAGPLMAATSVRESGGRIFVSTASLELRVYGQFPNVRFGAMSPQGVIVTGPRGFAGTLAVSADLTSWVSGEPITFADGLQSLGTFEGGDRKLFFSLLRPRCLLAQRAEAETLGDRRMARGKEKARIAGPCGLFVGSRFLLDQLQHRLGR